MDGRIGCQRNRRCGLLAIGLLKRPGVAFLPERHLEWIPFEDAGPDFGMFPLSDGENI